MNLEIQVDRTQVGVYTVSHYKKYGGLDTQETYFASNGLKTVSPAELGFLRAQGPKDTFHSYSRTNADVFYDDRGKGRVVIVPNGAISRQVGIANLVNVHRQGGEYVIPVSQRQSVYAAVDAMLECGTAFVAPDGETVVLTANFGSDGFTSRLFSDDPLGIKAQVYGDWLRKQGIDEINFSMGEYGHSQMGRQPSLNRLRVCGPELQFEVAGDFGLLDGSLGAFGVRFEKAANGSAKSRSN